MKKRMPIICSVGLIFLLSGCSPVNYMKPLLSVGDIPEQEISEAKPRVYMDEIKGILRDFSGDTLSIVTDNGNEYYFDLSQASLECENGMITGDEVTVIYEGQLPESDTSTDTSQIKVLKVVNDYRFHTDPEENIVSGKLQELTPNQMTLMLNDGKVITFLTTGCKQYYSSGMQKGTSVTVHYLGSQESAISEDENSYNAYHVKPVSASDTEPFKIPKKLVLTEGEETPQTFKGIIQDLELNTLTIVVTGSSKTISLDLSDIPAAFPGGPMPGSGVTVSYDGAWDGSTLSDITLLAVVGENPAKMKEYNIGCSVTGNIRGHTKNTVTLLSTDGAYITFRTDNAVDNSTSAMETGANIRVIFNPEDNRLTNVFSCLRIEDA